VESELFAGLFLRAGWRLSPTAAGADLLLLNTCAFIAPAVEESLEAVAAAERWKMHRKGRSLVLAGCLPGRFPDDGSGGLEIFDLVVRPGELGRLAEFLGLPDAVTVQARIGAHASRYLRIADGCSNRCAFCTIPGIRGPFRPERSSLIYRQADALVSAGAREVGLVAQDSGAWSDSGMDVCDLLESLSTAHPEVLWRLYYIHPSHFPSRLAELFASRPNVAPWVDLPLQHASDGILRRMGRNYDRSTLERITAGLDAAPFPIALRATVIAGYPGETEEDFEELREFLCSTDSLRSLVVFPYSSEEGTLQADRGDMPVPEELTAERVAILGLAGESAAWRWAELLQDREIEVVSDTGRFGHSVFDAPEIDGTCTFTSRVEPGLLLRCRVVEAMGLDMRVSPAGAGN
jgi:ribosomal protein S12 methylthiotransferase